MAIKDISAIDTFKVEQFSTKKVKDILSREELIQRITFRREKLKQVSKNLKAYFVGLDDIIDKIISNIEVWYVMPEVICRPVIVNLWGLTGCGKTSAVRMLVKELSFADSFVEIQLTNNGSINNYYSSSIQSILGCSNLETGKPGVLLLDEIQRFRSIDENNMEIHDYKFQDVWMLLSDGKFSGEGNGKQSILEMIFKAMYSDDIREFGDEETGADITPGSSVAGNATKKKNKKKKSSSARRYHQSYYTAKTLKKLLRLHEPVEEIMTWNSQKQNQVLLDKLNYQDVYEGDDYSKLLIFISGNLDEAYEMSDACEDADQDADVFHDHSLKINVVSIKKALKKRFKPEQIARFGNIHVIYPSLSSESYCRIIDKRIKEMQISILDKYKISFEVDESIKDLVYRNGIYASQGVRPLFSTISSCIENSLPLMVLKAIENNEKHIRMYYEGDSICGEIGKETYKIKYEGDLDTVKANKNVDRKVCTSVHEAGHAIAYAVQYGLVPTQIVANAASDDVNGFVGCHDIGASEENILKKIIVFMAGRAAEEIVFGNYRRTGGASGDITSATSLASAFVRTFGMSEFVSRVQVPTINTPGCETYNHNSEPTNTIMEDLLKRQKDKATDLIMGHLPLLKSVSDILIRDGSVETEEFKKICAEHKIDTKIVNPKDSIYSNYEVGYKTFFADKKH